MEEKTGRTPEETMEGGIRLNWEVIFAEATFIVIMGMLLFLVYTHVYA